MKYTLAIVGALFSLVSALPAETTTALSERAPDIAQQAGPQKWGDAVGNTHCYLRADLDKTSQPALFDFTADWSHNRQTYNYINIYTDSWGQFPAVKLLTGPDRNFAKFDVSHSNKYGTWRWVIAAIYHTDKNQLTFDVDLVNTEIYGSHLKACCSFGVTCADENGVQQDYTSFGNGDCNLVVLVPHAATSSPWHLVAILRPDFRLCLSSSQRMKVTAAVVGLLCTLVSALPAETTKTLSERAPDITERDGSQRWGGTVGNTHCYLLADLNNTSQPALYDFTLDWSYSRQTYADINIYTDSWGQFPAVELLSAIDRTFSKFDVSHSNEYGTWRWVIAVICYFEDGRLRFDVDFKETEIYGSRLKKCCSFGVTCADANGIQQDIGKECACLK
ncbi:uncharacterized protein L969DRAFT_49876 [Mixia osmundae IAM 14324]|uniref:Uncharacterized protein n=1 Tax=Mixia osmundae (strain CBS 9802 / IAM 14324 / JCM 22182 / KY 12970) TaxID=764103 RepID=G7E736_MIXOS|nr:uncharacterized protein L969DRAFT_49876 [Mixia osmundae IAM 14324]KEI38971.1 hypothetical protein L969DRAFT_49876 [Mixia osmundae IAM 14324]GAA98646.1 hypothetical protein E5Q_05333 [Mixia osmundae IAM 14324]